jgi:hypothetical protein
VFKVAKDSRAAWHRAGRDHLLSRVRHRRGGKQIAYDNDVKPTKTWVTGPNPRPEHAAMDGETVGIDEDFSDGNGWPGGDPGCNCSVDVEIP